MTSTDQPPPWVLEAARVEAMKSPCQKSKRGAAIYSIDECDDILEGRDVSRAAFLGIPYKADRYKSQSIVDVAHNAPPNGWGCSGSEACRRNCGKLCRHAEERAILAAGILTRCENLAMVHVKVVDGVVVAGGPPSCWQCSRLIADCGIRGIWLYEKRFEAAEDMHPAAVGRELEPAWKFYDARVFHTLTLAHEGIEQ